MSVPTRDTARLVVLDPSGRLLLIQYRAQRDLDPARPGDRGFWFTPGGGLEPGETHEQAAARELKEETGISGVPIGPHVASREALIDLFLRRAHTRERYFLVRAPSDRLDTSNLAGTEMDEVMDVRWWELPGLAASGAHIEPQSLLPLAQELVAGRVPPAPIQLG